MHTHLNWHNLPPDMRLGSAPNDEVVLYRGFAAHQLHPEHGMVSTAVESGDLSSVLDVIDAVETRDLTRLIHNIAAHTVGSAQKFDVLTPFVSATPNKSIAENYAGKSGEKVARLVVRADQIVTVPLLSYEALVFGSVSLDQIITMEDVPVLPKPPRRPMPTAQPHFTGYSSSVIRQTSGLLPAPRRPKSGLSL